ncbi:MAG TPA: hypothetical protein PKA55_01675 [Rhodoblastus sp.]|nr:hypothetical protein [Rhodoblastus sp.]
MTVVSMQKLSADMQSRAAELVDRVGLVPQANDRPVEAGDLLFYISETSMPMAAFLRKHGLFTDYEGLHFDLAEFGDIRALANKIIAEREAGNLDGVWREFDLSTDDDVDNDGGYILTALAALDLLYGPRS